MLVGDQDAVDHAVKYISSYASKGLDGASRDLAVSDAQRTHRRRLTGAVYRQLHLVCDRHPEITSSADPEFAGLQLQLFAEGPSAAEPSLASPRHRAGGHSGLLYVPIERRSTPQGFAGFLNRSTGEVVRDQPSQWKSSDCIRLVPRIPLDAYAAARGASPPGGLDPAHPGLLDRRSLDDQTSLMFANDPAIEAAHLHVEEEWYRHWFGDAMFERSVDDCLQPAPCAPVRCRSCSLRLRQVGVSAHPLSKTRELLTFAELRQRRRDFARASSTHDASLGRLEWRFDGVGYHPDDRHIETAAYLLGEIGRSPTSEPPPPPSRKARTGWSPPWSRRAEAGHRPPRSRGPSNPRS